LVGFLKQETAEGHAAALAARQYTNFRFGVGAAEGVHGLLQLRVQVPAIGGVDLVLQRALAGQKRVVVGIRVGEGFADLVVFLEPCDFFCRPFLHDFTDSLGFIQPGFLIQDPGGVALAEDGLSVEVVVDPRHDPQHRGLARAVEAQHADLGSMEVGQGDVLDDGLAVVKLRHPHHGVDDGRFFIGVLGHAGPRKASSYRRGGGA
jgi:hypothetical protein